MAFAMSASFFYAPNNPLRSNDNVVEAATVGQTWKYNYTGGQQTFTAPNVGLYKLEVWGAEGGATSNAIQGGYAGYSYGNIELAKGESIYVYVGGMGATTSAGGYNGGGHGYDRGGGGGGATDIRKGGTGLGNRVIVAGGGGGAGVNGSPGRYGDGGGLTSENGSQSNGCYVTGANQSTGGNAYCGSYTPGQNGTLGQGGNANMSSWYGTGGGGGGYYGGAGGTVHNGGSGGSGYVGGVIEGNTTSGVFTGHGQVVITFVEPIITSQSPANATKFQNSYVDVSWTGGSYSDSTVTKYEIQAGTTPGGNNILALTDKGTTTSQRITVPAGTAGNTTIYWRVRVTDSIGRVGQWQEQTVIYSNNVPTITASTNVPAKLDVSLEKRNHQFSINKLVDPDDFNYVSLFADVLDASGNVIAGSKKQIVLDSSLVNSSSLISGTATEKDGSLQGPVNHATPFNLKVSLQPNFTTGKFDLTLTKADGVTNVIKSGGKLITAKTMQASSAAAPENYTLRIYPEDRQNTNALSAAPLAGINDVTAINIPFTADTRNYLPKLTNVKDDVANRVFSDAEGFNRLSVTGHVDDSDPADTVTMYYEVQPKAANYSIQVATVSGKVVPRYGKATKTFDPKVDADFAFTYQVSPDLDSGNYALLVYGYDSQEGIGDYKEIPFTVNRGGPTIDFVADYQTPSGQTITMSSAQKQLVAENNKAKIYFSPNNYATFEYAGYLIRGGAVKDLRIRGAFTNNVKATFIGVDFGKDPITLMNGEQTDFKLGDIIVFKFKATSATGIVTQKDVRILIADDNSNFDPINDANLPSIP